MVLVEAGVLPSIGKASDVLMVALYAFAAGWSEPFALKTLNRFMDNPG
jgi:hypothetical protein